MTEGLTSNYLRVVRRIHPSRFLRLQSWMDETSFLVSVSLLQLYRKKTEFQQDARAIHLAQKYLQYASHEVHKMKHKLNPTEHKILQSYLQKMHDAKEFWETPYIFDLYTSHEHHWRQLIAKKYPARKFSHNMKNMDIMAALAYQQRLYIDDLCQLLPLKQLQVDWNLVDQLCNWNYYQKQRITNDRPYFQELDLTDGTTTRMVTAFKDSKKKEIVLAFRGTNTLAKNDLTTDIGILAGTIYKYPRYEMAASMIMHLCNDPQYTGYTISTCGHSLGGSLAMFAFLFIPDDRRGTCIGFNPGVGVSLKSSAQIILHTLKDIASGKNTDISSVTIRGNFGFHFIKSCKSNDHCATALEEMKSCICKTLPCPSKMDIQKRIKEIYVVRHASDIISLGWQNNTDVNIVEIGRIPKISPYFAVPNDIHKISTSLNIYHQMSCFVTPYIKTAIEMTMKHFPFTSNRPSYSNDTVLDTKCKEFRRLDEIVIYKNTLHKLFNLEATKKVCGLIARSTTGFANMLTDIFAPSSQKATAYDHHFLGTPSSPRSLSPNIFKSSANEISLSTPQELSDHQNDYKRYKYAQRTMESILCQSAKNE